MATKSVTELAQALSDTDRKDLLERIQRSLNIGKKDNATIYHAQVSADYRAQMVRQGLQELSIWQRLTLWLRRVFSGKTEEELYLDIKMGEIAHIIQAEELADTEARYILPALPERIYRLYMRVLPLSGFMNYLWGSEKHMRDAVHFVLTHKIPKAKTGLSDFIAPEEMESLFEASETKAGLRQELLSRLNSYMDGIPAEVFTQIEEGILPLYYLKEICSFDFASFFGFFQVEVRGANGKNGEFKPASVDKILDELEHMYYALHTARKGTTSERLHPEFIQYYQNRAKNEVAAVKAPRMPEYFMPPPNEPEVQDRAVVAEIAENALDFKAIQKDIRDLRKEIELCLDHAHISELIRFFRADPYYKFLAYVPNLNLRDFFYALTRMELMESLDKEYAALRKRVIDKILRSVFRDPVREFEYYRKHPIGLLKSGLPGFRYVDSINIIYNYVGTVFVGYVRDMLRLLMKVLPARNRENSSELSFHINGIESLYEKVKIVDLSFASEAEEGKNLMRFRANIEKDVSQERAYRVYVANKDREMRAILEEGMEHLKSLAEALEEVLQIPAEMIDERFQSASGMVVSGGFHKRFEEMVREMNQIQRATRYQRILEEEIY